MLPRLIEIGPFTLHSFGLMVILGFGSGLWLAARLARQRGLPGDAFIDAAVLTLFASVIGARLLFVALNWDEYSRSVLEVAALWRGGMSFHGGVIAGVLSGVFYMRWRRIPVGAMADAAAPGLAVGYAVGRIGCFLNGCCYGVPTDLPWGVHFPGVGGDPAAHYHPAQLYATIINLLLAALLVRAYARPHRVGQIMALYVCGYSIYRFLIESLRKGVTAEVFALGLTEAQVFSALSLALGVAWWYWLQRRGTPAPALAPATTEGAPAVTGA
ncbi:MAG: prolipoprotein diacylglyceryl transferase [Actinomycetota bacterium]